MNLDDCIPELKEFYALYEEYCTRKGIAHVITSAKRAPRKAGDKSYHIIGQAFDDAMTNSNLLKHVSELFFIFNERVIGGYKVKEFEINRGVIDGRWAQHLHIAIIKDLIFRTATFTGVYK